MARKNEGTTRRGFLGSLGVAAALPLFPTPATHVGAPGSFTEAVSTHADGFRAAYLAELARFAESLRPRFVAGALRAFRENDHRRKPGATGWGDDAYINDSPQWEVERLAAEHFGVTFARRTLRNGDEVIDGDSARARLILAVSPHADSTGEGDNVHPCDHARESVGWDVIAYARAQGWYTPTDDETQDPILEHAECRECGGERFMHTHEGEDGEETRSADPDACPVRYVKHVADVAA